MFQRASASPPDSLSDKFCRHIGGVAPLHSVGAHRMTRYAGHERGDATQCRVTEFEDPFGGLTGERAGHVSVAANRPDPPLTTLVASKREWPTK